MSVYIAVAVAVVAASSPLILSLSERQREKALERYATRMHLTVSPQVRPRVVARIVAYERATLLGGVGGALIGLAVGVTVPQPTDSGSWTSLAVMLGLSLGMMLATVATATVRTLQPHTGPRIARASVPTLADYVPPLERWGTRIALVGAGFALLGAALALAVGVVPSDSVGALGVLHSLGAVLAYLALGLHVIGRMLSDRILDSGQPAQTQQELAWDDALRASTLRGLVVLPGVLAVVSVLTIIVRLGAQATNPPDYVVITGGAAFILVFSVGVATALVDAMAKPSQHYWRRLWRSAPQPAVSR